MDVTEMTYDSNIFDIIIDKSTIDALLCGNDAFLNTAKMLKVNLLKFKISRNVKES
jgi:hypothetical protein